ncbi:MAG: D-lyxose/D-mannose family sugar isomerase, partial [Clostridia bacterium]
MKRSEINNILKENIAFLKRMKFNLPPFAFFTPEEWLKKGHEYDEIRNNMLGWDITDYGHDDFSKIGL